MREPVVVVVGDVIVDERVECRALGLSSEGPVVTAAAEKETVSLGGAALVARHLAAEGVAATLVTMGPPVICNNKRSAMLDMLVRGTGCRCRCDLVEGDADWAFTRKRRYFVDGQRALHVNALNKARHTSWSHNLLVERVMAAAPGDDEPAHIVICDNGHGVIDRRVAEALKSIAGATTYVDQQVSQVAQDLEILRGCGYAFMNERERCEALRAFSWHLSLLGCLGNITKLGRAGAEMRCADMTRISVSAPEVSVVDALGAGDAFLAGFVAAKARGEDDGDALVAAVRRGTASTMWPGTSHVPTKEEVDAI